MMPATQHPTAFDHHERGYPAVFAVVHATGDTCLDDIVRFYVESGQGVAPHYVIDYGGEVHQFVAEGRIAYHVGYGPEEADLFRAGWEVWSRRLKAAPWKVDAPAPRYATWRARWPDADSPRDLAPGPDLATNHRSVGIELRSPEHRQPAAFFPAQYAALAAVLRDVAGRHGFPLDRAHVLGHYDCNPISRGDARGDYDPGEAFDWPGLLGACAA